MTSLSRRRERRNSLVLRQDNRVQRMELRQLTHSKKRKEQRNNVGGCFKYHSCHSSLRENFPVLSIGSSSSQWYRKKTKFEWRRVASSIEVLARKEDFSPRRTTMTDYLTALPVELLHIIFDDLSVDDIFASMCFVNKRRGTVCLTYRRFQFDFNPFVKKKTQFRSVCTYLLHVWSETLSLTFSNKYDSWMSLKITRFFSRFVQFTDGFSKLNSITIDPIDEQTWRSINHRWTTLVSLISLFIHCNEYPDLSITSPLLRELLFDSPKPQRLHVNVFVDGSDTFIVDPCPSTRRSQIEHLSRRDSSGTSITVRGHICITITRSNSEMIPVPTEYSF